MSWLSELIGGKKPAAPSPAEPPAPFKAGWPIRLTMDGIAYEIDRTQSEPLATLQDRVTKKALKGIKVMFLRELERMPGHVEVYWIRPVVVKASDGAAVAA